MSYFCGIDLGAKKSQICIIDDNQQVLYQKKIENDMTRISSLLEPYRVELKSVVESTFNWYWLVDGLQDRGFHVILAHTLGLSAITKAKVKTDHRDALTLAKLLKAKMIPEAYIYPKDQRPVRDLLRKRWDLVSRRADEYRTLRMLLYRNGICDVGLGDIKSLDEAEIRSLLSHPLVQKHAIQEVERVTLFSRQIDELEDELLRASEGRPEYALLTAIPGIGQTLAMTIMHEIGDIGRFPDARHFSSYCRVVPGCADSGESRKRGRSNKQGNPYLKWAFTQAATKAVAFYPRFKAYFDHHARKHVGRGQKIITYSIVAHRLALAVYHVLKTHNPYDEEKLFGSPT